MINNELDLIHSIKYAIHNLKDIIPYKHF